MARFSSIEISGELPDSLDAAMAAFLAPYVGGSLTEAAVLSLRASIRARDIPQYDHAWAPFNYLYFSSNFLKANLAARVASKHLPSRQLRLLDLGCGGGASTAGFISGLSDAGHFVSHVTAIDCNRSQVEVFRSVAWPWLSLHNQNIEIELIESNFVTYACDHGNEYDVVLLSYSLCELQKEDQEIVRAALLDSLSRRKNLSIVIESDPRGYGMGLEFVGRIAEIVPYDSVIFECPHIAGLGLEALPKFSRSLPSNIFGEYVQCWKNHDVRLLELLFHDECRYQINDDRTLIGIGAIRDYWTHNSIRQQNVNVRYSVLLETVSCVIVEWVAEFDRIDTRDHRHLMGMMVIELSNGKIVHLREVYVQRRSGIKDWDARNLKF